MYCSLLECTNDRIELSQRRPPVFSILLNSVPKSLDPNKVLPQGALVSVARGTLGSVVSIRWI